MYFSEGVLIACAIAWRCGVVRFEEIPVLGSLQNFDDDDSQKSRGPLSLPQVCLSSVFSGTTANICFIFALISEWKQLFQKIKWDLKSFKNACAIRSVHELFDCPS